MAASVLPARNRKRTRIAWLLVVIGSLLLTACVYSSAREIQFKRPEHPWIPESRLSSGWFVWSEMTLSTGRGTRFGRRLEIPFVGGFWVFQDELIMVRLWDTLPTFDGWVIFLNVWLISTIFIVVGGGRLALEWHRIRRRRKQGRCLHCGYLLEGNLSGVCPECGTHAAANPGDSGRRS